MISLPGYQINVQIYESANSIVYRGIREADNQPVILKRLKEDYPSPQELTRYKQEYEITRSLNLEGIVRAECLERYQNTLVIIFSDIGGNSLKTAIAENRLSFSLPELLRIAIQISESLGTIHAANIIHKDINPSNIVFNSSTGKLKLIDFGISTQLTRENPSVKNPQVIEGTLAYISPEQTGRMNRSLDYRTDFYSLGVTLYELLTKQLPFESKDAMELVHCHLAKQPIPPQEINSEIPNAISDIVMKLMAKTAEERYQSAWGLKADLEFALSELEKTGRIKQFPLACRDISDKFQIPQKLYGREGEVETLLRVFERVANPTQSNSELMLVTGYSGIGKSALVKEIYKPITQKWGYFISGKFDQFQRNIPYSAVVAAFSDLARQLLTETEEILQEWRKKLVAAVGTIGKVIVDVIPEIELIIGEMPEVPELGPTESQNRFNLAFSNLIRAVASQEHPLVIFLDDLQWVDSASLKLIELMMTDEKTEYLLIIGAYRDNEVNQFHPLMLTVEKLRELGKIVNKITLSSLAREHICQLLAETLHSEISTVESLAELIMGKTLGNPFFVNEFLKTLDNEGAIAFNFTTHAWEWDVRQIEEMRITDNVVDLLISKLKKLPIATQKILRIAACIGATFDLNTLAIVTEKAAEEVFLALKIALQLDLIVSSSDLDDRLLIQNYKFGHDRIQQAAYTLIDEDRKLAVHLRIGRLLLQSAKLDTLPSEDVFVIVDHFNLAINLITDERERDRLARLNLIAGRKAKASAAYKSAFNYLKIGLELLEEDSWKTQYNLTLSLQVEATEAAHLSGNFEQMESLSSIGLQRAKTLLDKIKIYEIKIQACGMQNQPLAAVKTALVVLKLLGVTLPEKPNKLRIKLAQLRTKLSLAGRRIENLIELPEMTDPTQLAAMRILAIVLAAALNAAPELMLFIVLAQINLSVKHGNTAESAFAYAWYGLILCGVTGDIEAGFQFGQLALRLVEKLNAKELKPRVVLATNMFAIHWKQHFRETLTPFVETYQNSLDTGDLEFAAYAAHDYCLFSFYIGKELRELETELAAYGNAISQIKQTRALQEQKLYHQVVLNLIDRNGNPCDLIGEVYDERTQLTIYQQANDLTLLFYIYSKKLMLCYLFGQSRQAVENASFAEQYLGAVTSLLFVPIFYFYDALAQLAVLREAVTSEKRAIIAHLKNNLSKLKKWAVHAPMNHEHKFYLVEAERHGIMGRDPKAMDFYDRAINLAKEHGYINEEALANELAAKFYLAKGKTKLAQVYLLEARYCYLKWGATRKVKHLEETYPQLRTSTLTKIADSQPTSSSTHSSSGELLDLATVLKASQAIAGEIVLDRLLRKLMKISIENAGAQTGFLILDKAGKWEIEASGEAESETITVLQSLPIDNCLSESAVNYVARTKETVVLNNASGEGNFVHDPYIKAHQTKSILCTPLINRGQLAGIIYLENNLTTGAFTPERLEVLQLLSGQAAIALTNASLYSQLENYSQQLEQKVEERTAQLAEATHKAEAANEAKSSFLANMSHELRSPLNAILGFAQLMDRSRTLPPEHQENVSIISRSGEHLLALINQVLDLSKIEAGRTTLNEKNFDLIRLLDDIEDMFQLKANDKGLQLVCDRAPDLPRYARTDELKLRQVLINLLNNALKFTAEGGVSLRVSTVSDRQQQQTADRSQLTIHFEIEDTGAGIAPKELDSLFEAFVQTSTGKQAPEGTGLGLPISRKFVQLMGGDIAVRSRVGEGTTFMFDIQITTIAPAEIETAQPKRRVIALAPNQPRYRILIVDDNSVNRQLLIKLLNPLGFELQEASNGAEAVDIWDRWEPHLIWMDMRMPIMDGYEATKQIKATVKGQATAVIALTASVLEEERAVVLSAGCDGFLHKPFREDDILAMINKHIGVRYICDELTAPAVSDRSVRDVPDILAPSELAEVPVELLAKLERAANFADIQDIDRYIAEIRSYNATVADALAALAFDFEYSRIVRLIRGDRN